MNYSSAADGSRRNNAGQAALEAFVHRLSQHSNLSEEERGAILGLPTQLEEVRGHSDFVRPGDITDHSCLIADGLVGKYGQAPDGKRQIVSLHIPGEMVDLPSVVVPQATAVLTALAPSAVFKIAHRSLRDLSFEYPAIAVAFWRSSVLDGAIVIQLLVNVGRRTARERLAHLLCEMSVRNRLTKGGDGMAYDLPMSQEQLGDALGLTSVHVNRTLRDLRQDGLISTSRGGVEIKDWLALVHSGDFEIDYLLSKPPSRR